MDHPNKRAPLAVAVGAALTVTLAASPVAADANPFGLTELAGGYMLATAAGSHGQQETGEKKDEEGRCGEGKCGEGACGGHDEDADDADDADDDAEGRCGGGA